MRAVKAHSGVVRSFYVRQRNHAVGKSIAMSFGRRSGAQFAAETVATCFAFFCSTAGAIADFFIVLSAGFNSNFNEKRATRVRTFAHVPAGLAA
jgi:hypothetical protein